MIKVKIPLAYKEKIDRNNKFIPKEEYIKAWNRDRIRQLLKTGHLKCINSFKKCHNFEECLTIDLYNSICTINNVDLEEMVCECTFDDEHQDLYNKDMKIFLALAGITKFKETYTELSDLIILYPVCSSTILNPYEDIKEEEK